MDELNENTGRKASANAPSQPVSAEDEKLLREADAQFIGSFSHTIDAKGRVVVPASFREKLGDRFYIAPSYDFGYVSLYTKLSWSRLHHSYEELVMQNSSVAMLMDQFNALSYGDQECDGQGRVLLPPRIRQLLLGDDKELEISGAGDHVNITTAAMAAKKFQQMMDDMPNIMKTVNQLRANAMNANRMVLIDRRGE